MEHKNDNGKFVKGLFCGVLLVLICMAGTLFHFQRKMTKLQLGTSREGISEQLDMDMGAVKQKTKEIENLINQYYLDEIDEQQIEDTMYTGLVAGLDDPYSVYYTE